MKCAAHQSRNAGCIELRGRLHGADQAFDNETGRVEREIHLGRFKIGNLPRLQLHLRHQRLPAGLVAFKKQQQQWNPNQEGEKDLDALAEAHRAGSRKPLASGGEQGINENFLMESFKVCNSIPVCP